jgi:hypothetical protein
LRKGRGFDVLDLVGDGIVVTFPYLLLYFVGRVGLLLFVAGEEPNGERIYLVEEMLLPYLLGEQILVRHTCLDDVVRGRGVVPVKEEANPKYRFSVNQVDYTKVTRK